MRICLAMLAVLAMTAAVSADSQVWFVVDGEGGPGMAPEFTIDAPTTFHVEVWIATGAPGTFGYNIAINQTGPCPGEFGTPIWTGIPGWTTDTQYAPHPFGYADIMFGQSQTTAPWTGEAMVLEFDITKDPAILGDNILVAGPGLYWTWGGGGALVQYGAGEYGPEGYTEAVGTMMTVHCVPEPATIALLALGVVGLIRRR